MNDTANQNMDSLTARKVEAEIAKLEKETEAMRRQPLTAILNRIVPAIIILVATTVIGYYFNDSLQERTKAEIRKEVLSQYFEVENNMAGKRLQILEFTEDFLADDDEALHAWLTREKEKASQLREELKGQQEEIRAKLDEVREVREIVTTLVIEPDEESATHLGAGDSGDVIMAEVSPEVSRAIEDLTHQEEQLKAVEQQIDAQIALHRSVPHPATVSGVPIQSVNPRILRIPPSVTTQKVLQDLEQAKEPLSRNQLKTLHQLKKIKKSSSAFKPENLLNAGAPLGESIKSIEK